MIEKKEYRKKKKEKLKAIERKVFYCSLNPTFFLYFLCVRDVFIRSKISKSSRLALLSVLKLVMLLHSSLEENASEDENAKTFKFFRRFASKIKQDDKSQRV